MKPRPDEFLTELDYICELHGYLWRFIRVVYPNASGNLKEWVDDALAELKSEFPQSRAGMTPPDAPRRKSSPPSAPRLTPEAEKEAT